MQRLSDAEFSTMLNSILHWIWFSEKNKIKLDSIGVDHRVWPEKYKAKALAIKFFELVEKENYLYAQQSMSREISSLNRETIPEDLDLFKIVYHQNLSSQRALILADKIVSSPLECQSFIHEFQEGCQSVTETKELKNITVELIERNEKLIAEGKSKVILPDFPILSDLASGFNPGRITIISAKSGFGKTKLAINLAYSAARIMPVLYFNMEMSEHDFSSLFLHRHCKISNNDWIEGRYLNENSQIKILNYQNELCDLNPIYLHNSSNLPLHELSSTAIKHLSGSKLSMIVVDYDQKLINKSYENEWMGILKAIEELESLSKTLNAHVIVLAQGDEDGRIKSSARAMQPASLVLSFLKNDQGKNVLKCLKNRHKFNDWSLEVTYEPQYSLVKEIGLLPPEVKRTGHDVMKTTKRKAESWSQ